MGKNKRHAGKGHVSKESSILYDRELQSLGTSFSTVTDNDDEINEENQTQGEKLTVKLCMWEFGQNDPNRDSGSKMRRLGYAEKLRLGQTFAGIVLSSETDTILSPADKSIVERNGLAGINCSWNRISEIPFEMMGRGRNQRILPLLYAANTVNYGKPSKLNTAEAMAASLYISGFRDDAISLLQPFSYGEEFIRMNLGALDAYASCRDSTEVARVQQRFIQESLAFQQEKEELRKQRCVAGGGVVTDYLDGMDLPPVVDDDFEDEDGDDNGYDNTTEDEEALYSKYGEGDLTKASLRSSDEADDGLAER